MNTNNLTLDDEVVTVDFAEMADIIVYTLQPNGLAAIFEGPPGCGKTKTIWSIMNERQAALPDFGACYHNFGGSDLKDGIGLPKNTNNRFSEMGVPPWAMPYDYAGLRGAYRDVYKPEAHDLSILHASSALNPYPMGVACFDEPFTSPAVDLRLGMAEFFCEGRFGDWQLPEAWAKVGLTNNAQHRSGVKEPFMHMRNRVFWMKVRPSVHDQLAFWKREGMRQEFVLFAKCYPELVLSRAVPSENRQWPTARSWTKAEQAAIGWSMNKMGLDPDNDPLPMTDRVFCALIAGAVGEATLNAFKTFMTDMSVMPTYAEVMAGPSSVTLPRDPLKQKNFADMLAYSAKADDVSTLIICARRMDKPIAGIFGASVGKTFGSLLARNTDFLDFMDWCGHGSKLQMAQP